MYKQTDKRYALTSAIHGNKVIRLLYSRFFRVVRANNKYQDLIIEEVCQYGQHVKWHSHKSFRQLPDSPWFIM